MSQVVYVKCVKQTFRVPDWADLTSFDYPEAPGHDCKLCGLAFRVSPMALVRLGGPTLDAVLNEVAVIHIEEHIEAGDYDVVGWAMKALYEGQSND